MSIFFNMLKNLFQNRWPKKKVINTIPFNILVSKTADQISLFFQFIKKNIIKLSITKYAWASNLKKTFIKEKKLDIYFKSTASVNFFDSATSTPDEVQNFLTSDQIAPSIALNRNDKDYDGSITTWFNKFILKQLLLVKKYSIGIFKKIFGYDYLGLFMRFLFLIGIIVILFLLSMAGAFVYYTKDLPVIDNFSQIKNIESTKIYDRTGTILLYEVQSSEKRTVIHLTDIPQNLVNATITAEDVDFYSHKGINPKSLLRALDQNIKTGTYGQGASTITQQLIKNTVLSDEKTLDRKIKEVFLSFEIERKYSKNQILELYLNRIPYGSNIYGVQAAAETYFGKNAKDLTLAQCALLAALTNRPTYLSPYGPRRDTDLKSRQIYILGKMQKLGMITPEQKLAAINENWVSGLKNQKVNIIAPHFVFYVKDLLEKRAIDEGMYGGDIETAGLKVITTIDLDLQAKAENIVREYSQKNLAFNIKNMALAAVETDTGQIVTMVGSVDYWDSANDGNVNVTTSYRQPGSSFKPYVYATAFQKGIGPNTIIYDIKTDFGGDGGRIHYIPNDFSHRFSGPVTVKQAIQQSLNLPAIKAFYVAGPKNVITLAHNMGLDNLDPNAAYGLSTALGTKEVRMIDHVAAMSVFGNRGYKVGKTPILKIYTNDGTLIEDNSQPPKSEKVVDENIANLVNYSLTRNSGDLEIPGHSVAAKTGTSSVDHNGRSYPRDTWTVGYTPKIAVAVWAGNNDGSILNTSAVSYSNAAPAYRAFMIEALKKYPKADFQAPTITGIHGEDSHSLLYYLGRTRDPQFKNWEKSIGDYLNKGAAPTTP
jgi:membrane peptidoglycan carboxypeptidase